MTLIATYLLRLTAPVVVAVPSGDVNSARSSPYLPGRALRGAVAARLSEPIDAGALDALIARGTVRFLPAYPSIDEARSSPAPLSWRCKKTDLVAFPLPPVLDLGATSSAASGDEEPERVRPPFAFVGGARWDTPVSSSLEMIIHIARDSRSRHRRPTKADGAVFSYEAIPAGTELHLAVVLPDADTADQLDRVLTGGPLRLGRSAAAGYGGRPDVTVLGREERELPTCPWRVDDDLAIGDRVRVLVTSDAIVRNPLTGHPDPATAGAAIETASGAKLRELPERRWVRSAMVGGFDNTWRLALPQVRAAVAGSILELEVTQPMTRDEVIALEHRGIGERRPDGYGAVVLLHPPDENGDGNAVRLSDPLDAPPPEMPSGGLPEEIRDLYRRILDAAVMRALTELGHDLASRATGNLPSRSLLGRLQNALRADLGRSTPTVLPEMLDKMAPRAREQLKQCTVEHKPLHTWITETLDADAETIAAKLAPYRGRLLSATLLPGEPEVPAVANAAFVAVTLAALARRAKQETKEQDADAPATEEAP